VRWTRRAPTGFTVDVMDGRFVPNISFGPVVLEGGAPGHGQAAQRAPDDCRAGNANLEDFARAGADHILVQAEPASTVHLHRTLSRVRELGKKAGAVVDPATPLEMIEWVLAALRRDPGDDGQSGLSPARPSCRRCCPRSAACDGCAMSAASSR